MWSPAAIRRHATPCLEESEPVTMEIGRITLQLPSGLWPTVFVYVGANFPSSTQAQWAVRFERGGVLDAEHNAITLHHPYRVSLTKHYYREVEDEPRIPFMESLVRIDEHLAARERTLRVYVSRVLKADIEICDQCGGAIKVITRAKLGSDQSFSLSIEKS
jgi:hypothetical protein